MVLIKLRERTSLRRVNDDTNRRCVLKQQENMVIALKGKASGSAARLGITLGAVVFVALGAGNTASEASEMRVSGLVSTHKYHVALEREFYKSLSDKTGIKINYNPLDVLGVSMKDTLRLARVGTFDLVESTAGEASRDDPFLEGLDLIGVSPSLDTLKTAVDAYRKVFSKRVEEKFNVKVMTCLLYTSPSPRDCQ